jgi:hypothetical protein
VDERRRVSSTVNDYFCSFMGGRSNLGLPHEGDLFSKTNLVIQENIVFSELGLAQEHVRIGASGTSRQ